MNWPNPWKAKYLNNPILQNLSVPREGVGPSWPFGPVVFETTLYTIPAPWLEAYYINFKFSAEVKENNTLSNVLRPWYICYDMPRPPSKKKFLTDLVLLILEKSIDGYVAFEDFANNPLLVGRDLRQSELSQIMKRLREKGLIELISDKELAFRLTDSGKDRALWKKIELGDEKWDRKWRLVIWDVPEKRRAARDLLRYKLKQLGFKQWQQSVWASKVNCTKLLRDFIRKTGIGDWVMVVETDNIG